MQIPAGGSRGSGTVSLKFTKSPQSGRLQGRTQPPPIRSQETFIKAVKAPEQVGRLLHG